MNDNNIDRILDDVLNRYYHFPNVALYRTLEINLISQVKEKLKPPILDIGCLDAKFAEILFGKQIHINEIIGIDIDKKFIKKSHKSDVYNDILLMSGEKMAFKDNTFNTVISNCVFEHVDDLYSLLKESFRVLNREGNLIATAHTSSIIKILMEIYDNEKIVDQFNRKDHHTSLWTIEKYKKILEELGYKEIEFKEYGEKNTIQFIYRIGNYYGRGGKYINLHNSTYILGLVFKNIMIHFQKKFMMNHLLKDISSKNKKASMMIIARKV